MITTYGTVGIAEHPERSLHDVGGGVAAAGLAARVQASLTPEVIAMLIRVAVMAAVELVQRRRPHHLKVGTRDELTLLVPYLHLRFYVDTDHHVK